MAIWLPPTPITCIWGLDVGGANLKLANEHGESTAIAFPMWTDSFRLSEAVHHLGIDLAAKCDISNWMENALVAVTMTGEMADCFESRRAGVRYILEQLEQVIPANRILVYSVVGKWLGIDQAKDDTWSVAASNWHALAQWCLGLPHWSAASLRAVIDIGSTTVDIIPINNGKVDTRAVTDRQRMELGQLVYTGMERTPIHSIVSSLQVEECRCPVMAERFATILDANLILACSDEEPDCCDTADGRPRTRRYALARLARMVGEDVETLTETTLISMARQVVDAQASQVGQALLKDLVGLHGEKGTDGSMPCPVLVSGHGRPLIERLQVQPGLANISFMFLDEIVGSMAARCAPALAVAQLLRQHCNTVAMEQGEPTHVS